MHHDEEVRLAIMRHEIGTPAGIWISGQVMDVDAEPFQVSPEDWDVKNGYYLPEQDNLTPYEDFAVDRVIRPLVSMEILDSNNNNRLSIPFIKGYNDGVFAHYIEPRDFEPGTYTCFVRCIGTGSLRQEMDDMLHTRHTNCPIKDTTRIIGIASLRILPEDYNGFYITSDIDQTYLQTDITSQRGLFSTLFQRPDEKMSFPGMPALYEHLRKLEADGAPTAFLSASPDFFRRTLYRKLQSESVEFDKLILKPYTDLVSRIAQSSWNKIRNLPYSDIATGAAFGIIWSFFEDSYINLKQQVGYKLEALLKQRLLMPTGAKEILIGDNMEADYFIFSLYQAILTENQNIPVLTETLRTLEFNEIKIIHPVYVSSIIALAKRIWEKHGKINPVEAVLIHKANEEIDAKSIKEKLSIYAVLENIPAYKEPIVFNTALQAASYLYNQKLFTYHNVVDIANSMMYKEIKGKWIDDNFIQTELQSYSYLSERRKQVVLNALNE